MIKISDNFEFGLYTCKLLSSVLNQTGLDFVPQDLSLTTLYQFQSFHNVTGATYMALKNYYNSEQIKEFELDYKKNLLRLARFEIAGQELYAVLEKECIPFIILKGAVLKDLYTTPAMRYFTDYDIYIGDRCPDVEKVMLALGYVYDHDTENDMDFIKKPSLHFEMHHSLFTDKYDFGGYFNNPFDKAVLREGSSYVYVLRNEDCFIYVLAHLYKHFTDGGCGIKQFMDIYTMMQKWSLDMEYIRGELKKIGLDGFLETSIKLNAFLFDDAEADDELKQIADYVFNNGTFGNVKNSMALKYAQEDEEEKKKFGLYKVKYFANRWQLSFSGMKNQYPILSKVSLLLPFCYIHKLFRVAFFRRDVLKSQIRDINDFSNDYSNYIDHILEISKAKIKGKN